MASARFRGTLLCEDVEHERFFRRLLERKWFRKSKLRVVKIPNVHGNASRFVVDNYAKEVQLARRWRNENRVLIVVVDGDKFGLVDRLAQLDEELKAAGLSKRSRNDKVLVFVPTWHIETWELWLCGHHDLNEKSKVKDRCRKAKARREVSVKDAIDAWFQQLSTEDRQREEHRLPSLAAGRQEIQRLEASIG